ncbi:MAG: pantetheine-phosphate adenylyltransferase [Nannocystaceae bacterium]
MHPANQPDEGAPGRRVAVYPGSFDPITLGHLEVARRAATLFDEVIIAVGQSPHKRGTFTVEERLALIDASVADHPRLRSAAFSGLVVEFCRSLGARVLMRGLRAASDFDGEFQMGLANRDLAPEIETVFLLPRPEAMFVSSSLIREIASHHGHFERYVSPPVAAALHARFGGRDGG